MIGRCRLDENKKLIPCQNIDEWGEWFFIEKNRRVDLTKVGDCEISTVFLGYPVKDIYYFESLVYGGKFHGAKKLSKTFQEAQSNHDEMVNYYKNKRI